MYPAPVSNGGQLLADAKGGSAYAKKREEVLQKLNAISLRAPLANKTFFGDMLDTLGIRPKDPEVTEGFQVSTSTVPGVYEFPAGTYVPVTPATAYDLTANGIIPYHVPLSSIKIILGETNNGKKTLIGGALIAPNTGVPVTNVFDYENTAASRKFICYALLSNSAIVLVMLQFSKTATAIRLQAVGYKYVSVLTNGSVADTWNNNSITMYNCSTADGTVGAGIKNLRFSFGSATPWADNMLSLPTTVRALSSHDVSGCATSGGGIQGFVFGADWSALNANGWATSSRYYHTCSPQDGPLSDVGITKTTPFVTHANGIDQSVTSLSNQDLSVDCGSNAGISQFRLINTSGTSNIRYNFTCKPSNYPLTCTTRTGTTTSNNTGSFGQGAINLDRLPIACQSDEFMSQFKFMVNTGSNTRYYQAQCCKPTANTKFFDISFDVSGGNEVYFVRSFIDISGSGKSYSPYVGFQSPSNTDPPTNGGLLTSTTYQNITVTNITTTSATIVFDYVGASGTNTFYCTYKTANGPSTMLTISNTTATALRFNLSGLTANTDYFFLINGVGNAWVRGSFKTLPSSAVKNLLVLPIKNTDFFVVDSSTTPYRFRLDMSGAYIDETNKGVGVEVLTATAIGAKTDGTALTPATYTPVGQLEQDDFLIIDGNINSATPTNNSLLYSWSNVVYTGAEVTVANIALYRTATGITAATYVKAIRDQLIYARENLRALMTSYTSAVRRYNDMKATFGLPDISGVTYDPANVPTLSYSTTGASNKVSNGDKTTQGAVTNYTSFISTRNTFLTYLRMVVNQIATSLNDVSPNTYTATEKTNLLTAKQATNGVGLGIPVVYDLITSFASATGLLKTFAYDKATDAVTKYNNLWDANSEYLPADARKYPSPNPLTANTPLSDLVTNYTYFAIQGPAAPSPSGSGSGGSGTTPLSYIGDLYYTIWCVADKSRQNYNNLMNAYNNFKTSVGGGVGVYTLLSIPVGINANITLADIPASTYSAFLVTSLNTAMDMLGIDGNVDTDKTAYATNKLQKLRNFVIEQMTAYITAFDTLQGNLVPTTQTLVVVSTTTLSTTMTTNSLIAAMAKYGDVSVGDPVTYSAPAGAILNAYSSLTLAQKRDAVLDLMADMTNLMEATSGGHFWNADISGTSISHNDPSNGSSSTLGSIWNGIGADTTAVPTATADVCDRKLNKYTTALTSLVSKLKDTATARITSYENLWDAFNGLYGVATSAFGPINSSMSEPPPKKTPRTSGLSGLIYPTQTIAYIRNTLSNVRTDYFATGGVRPSLVTVIVRDVPTFASNCNTAVAATGRLSLSTTSPTSQTALTITTNPALVAADTDTTLLARIRECVEDATAMTIRTYADLYSRLGGSAMPQSVRDTVVANSLTFSGMASGVSASYTEPATPRTYTLMTTDYTNYSKAIQMLYEAIRGRVSPLANSFKNFKSYYTRFAAMTSVKAIMSGISTTFPTLPDDSTVDTDVSNSLVANLPAYSTATLPTLTHMTRLVTLTDRYSDFGTTKANETLRTFVKGQINDNGLSSGTGFVQLFYNKTQSYAPTSAQLVTAVSYDSIKFQTDLLAASISELTSVMVRFGLTGTDTTAGNLLTNQQLVEDRYSLILLVQTYNTMLTKNGALVQIGSPSLPNPSPSVETLTGSGTGSIVNMTSDTVPSISTVRGTYTTARDNLFTTLKSQMKNALIKQFTDLYTGLDTFKTAVEASSFTTFDITYRPANTALVDSGTVESWTVFSDANNSALDTMRDKYYVDLLAPLVNTTRSRLSDFFDTYSENKGNSAAPAAANSYPDVTPSHYTDVSGSLTVPTKASSTTTNIANAKAITDSGATLITHLTNYGNYVGSLITATKNKLRTLPLTTDPSSTSTSVIDKFIYDYTAKQADITQVLSTYPRLGGTVIGSDGWATRDRQNVSAASWSDLIDLQTKYSQLNEDMLAALGNYSALSTARTNALNALFAYNTLYSANSSVIDPPLLRYFTEFNSYFDTLGSTPVTSATFNSKTEAELNQIETRFKSGGVAYNELSAIILPMRRIEALNTMGQYNTFLTRLKEYGISEQAFTPTELNGIATYVTLSTGTTTVAFNNLDISGVMGITTNYNTYRGNLITDTSLDTTAKIRPNTTTLIQNAFNDYGPDTQSHATPFVTNLVNTYKGKTGPAGTGANGAMAAIMVANNRNILDQLAELSGFRRRVQYAGLTGQYTQCLEKDVQSKGFLDWIFG